MRDLAERGVLDGRRGGYVAHGDIADITVPATLQATIAARVDRLDAAAKRTLNAAAAIGSRFSADLVGRLVDDTDLPRWSPPNSSTRWCSPRAPSTSSAIR